MAHAKFDGVHGYATYENARRKGEAVERAINDVGDYRWVVIALPNGRYAPCVILNNNVSGGPGAFLSFVNLCMVN